MEIVKKDTQFPHRDLHLVKRDWDVVSGVINELPELWQSLAAKNLKDIAEVFPPAAPGAPITGNVLGKPFEVHVSPFVLVETCYALAVVLVPTAKKTETQEACRFLIGKHEQIFDINGSEIIGYGDNYPALVLLCNIVQHVLKTPI